MTEAPPASSGHVSPPADHADKSRTIVQRIADLRAWLFLAALIVGFEVWSRSAFGGSLPVSASCSAALDTLRANCAELAA